MLILIVNGESKSLPTSGTLEEALVELGFQGKHFAVAMNDVFVPRSQYRDTQLQGGERLEILSPMQGG